MSEYIEKAKSKEYSIVFDYLRVFAMLGVLAVHLSQQFPVSAMVKSIAARGAGGVQIFYVISAYLGCSYFFRAKASIKSYYKKRALRVLPIYYAAIVAAMLYVELVIGGFRPDIFHLGWLRYFLGLNTILPSDNWDWNNSFGFWAMTNFIFFYTVIPYVIKLVNSFRRSIIFFIICFSIAFFSKTVIPSLVGDNNFSDLTLLVKWSPLGQMRHFALGIMVFFAVRENKKSFAIIALIGLAMFCSSPMLFSILTGLFILSVRESDVKINGTPLYCLQFVSKYSFHIYLSHLLALSMAGKLALNYFSPPEMAFYTAKFAGFVVITVILCIFYELVQRTVNKFFSK